MSEIELLQYAANHLCKTLEKAAENEKTFSIDICMILEQYSWDMYKMTQHLKEIKEYVG
jgi:hypothetical protein